MGAYGDAQWVRNLRVAGEADITSHGQTEHITARELDREEATAFFRHVLQPYVAGFPWFGRLLGRILFRFAAPEILTDPAAAAATRPVFELSSRPRAS